MEKMGPFEKMPVEPMEKAPETSAIKKREGECKTCQMEYDENGYCNCNRPWTGPVRKRPRRR